MEDGKSERKEWKLFLKLIIGKASLFHLKKKKGQPEKRRCINKINYVVSEVCR